MAINVNIKPFASISEDLSSGKYFYKVELVGTPDLSNTELELNSDLVEYYKADEDELNISIVPFWKETQFGLVPANLGEGIAANFKVEVTLVQRKNSVDIPESDEDVFLSSQKLVLSTATKTPHYAEKISIKKGQTTLYAGEGYNTPEVKIGTVTFGKNDTFVTNQNWTIRTLIAPSGESMGSVSEPYSEEDDYLYGVKLYNSTAWNDYEDNGIYASIATNAMPGKYTAIIVTNDENGQTPEAKITFTVNSSVCELNLTSPNKIYKNGNKKVTAKTSVIAKTYCFTKEYGYSENIILKNPKLSYKVGIYNSMSEDIDAVEGITIDKKGVITIDKKFKVTDENKDTVYSVMVSANDYVGNPANPCLYSFTIVNEATKVKSLELYLDNGESVKGERYTKLNAKSSVPYDLVGNICIAVKGTDGKYIAGGNGKEGNNAPVLPNDDIEYNSYGKSGLMITNDINDISYIFEPTKVTFTLKSIDGSKASASFKVGYALYSNDFDNLAIGSYGQMGSPVFVSETGENAFEYEIPSSWGNNPNLIVALGNGVYPEELNTEEEENVAAFSNCVSGSISVSGAKVLMDYGDIYSKISFLETGTKISRPKKQYLIIKPTKSEVKITVTKPMYNEDGTLKTIKKQYVIKNNNASSTLSKAPKIKSAMFGVPSEKAGEYNYEKLSYGRQYKNSSKGIIEFKLAEPLKLPEGVSPEDVHIVLDTYLTESEAGVTIKNVPYSLDMENNPNKGGNAYYIVDENGKNPRVSLTESSVWSYILNQPKLNISLQYYYLKDSTPEIVEDDVYEKVFLTKPSSFTAKFTKYTKSFKANASQTLKFSAASGDTPATVTADFIKGKGKNVKSVELLKVCNCNVKGKYNDFDQFFEVKDGKLSVKESKLEVLNAEALKAKKKVPASKTGYVYYLVTYTDGSTQEILSKVTVKFAK